MILPIMYHHIHYLSVEESLRFFFHLLANVNKEDNEYDKDLWIRRFSPLGIRESPQSEREFLPVTAYRGLISRIYKNLNNSKPLPQKRKQMIQLKS